MKVLFLHLSDLHIKSIDGVSTGHVGKILDTLRVYEEFDGMFLIFSGDIAFSGKKEQYSAASSLLIYIFRKIKEKGIFKKHINIICVPGNHDMEFEEPPRTSEDLNRIFKDFSYSEHLPQELSKQTNFFDFANKSDCFNNRKLFDRKLISLGDFNVEVNMINSAAFSLKYDEDKGLHYINQAAINELNTPTGADFVVSVMHHAPEWYIDDQKHQLETALLCKSSLLFFGHEHWAAAKSAACYDETGAFIHAGGSLCNDSDWSKSEFEIGLLETDSLKYTTSIFSWNDIEQQYEPRNETIKQLLPKPSVEKGLQVTEDYKSKLLSDSYLAFSDNIQDYYVFPRIESETYDGVNREFLDIDRFLEEIRDKRRVLITGASNSGKTVLLKQLFLKLIENGKCVIICDIETFRRKDSSKIVKTNFEDIYGDSFSDYSRFLQLPPEQKVLIIDDIDQIRQQDFEEYIAGQSNNFGLMIFSTKAVLDLDMIKRMQIALKAENTVTKYIIKPFYADKRKELVEKLVLLKSEKDPSIIYEQTVEDICQAIKLQKRYVTLEPIFIIQFVDYYCNNIGTASGSDSSVFSKVFEANITAALSPFRSKNLTIDKLYKLLSIFARFIHFSKKYPATEEDILGIVSQYNDEYDDVVSPVAFLNAVTTAKILVSDNSGYQFANRNQLAYFCAKEVLFLYNDTGCEDDLKYLVKYCCFGINADILMFISYITDNPRILQLFLSMTKELTEGWSEFDFADNCPQFLISSFNQEVSIPNETSKQENERKEVETEKENNSKLQVIDIYDYNESEVGNLVNQIIRSLSLLMIISKCLPGFEHNMNAFMRKEFVKEIYSLPNKIYSIWAKEVDSVYDQLINYLKEQNQNEYHSRQVKSDADVETRFKLVAALLLLDIYNIAVNYATRDNSFRLLDSFEMKENLPYSILNLMMVEHQRLADRFVHDAIALQKACKQSLPAFLVKNVAVHAYINMGRLDRKNLDRLSTAFFQKGQAGQRQYLPEQKKYLIQRTTQNNDD